MSNPLVIENSPPPTVLTRDDIAAVEDINARVIGWSTPQHYVFFKAILSDPSVRRILVLGVYHGRDIAFMLDILRRYHVNRDITIVGVDRFTADPCADWSPAKEVRTWEEEVHAPPPNFDKAVENTRDRRVELVRSDDFQFLETTPDKFDVVYVDTSHDFHTVTRQLRQIPRVCEGNALICGDDYDDRHTWGVKSAVKAGFENHSVFASWIWYARRCDLKSNAHPVTA